nr:MAG TPA: hypothetical protein [Bacteriophage sp.]DAO24098.1 MAG TPA: hypothetical protein [Caudoviricetes sp.]
MEYLLDTLHQKAMIMIVLMFTLMLNLLQELYMVVLLYILKVMNIILLRRLK